MERKKKNMLIWVMFGSFLGALIMKTIRNIEMASNYDWFLIVSGILVTVIHYLPDKDK